ncbi:unnamed protein product, partial [Larinioides sclopetarius]
KQLNEHVSESCSVKESKSQIYKMKMKFHTRFQIINSYVVDTEISHEQSESAQDLNSNDVNEESNIDGKNNRHRQWRIWSKQEKFAFEKYFMSPVLRDDLPGLVEIQQCLATEQFCAIRTGVM